MYSDIKFAARIFWRHPLASIAIVVTLGCGVAANIGLFSIIHDSLFRPFPYAEADCIVRVYGNDLHFGRIPFSYADYSDWKNSQRSLSDIGCYRQENYNLRSEGAPPERVSAVIVTASFFEVLRLSASYGRLFGPEADRALNNSFPVVISHGFWSRHFHADPNAVGQYLSLNDKLYQIIGVTPAALNLPTSNLDVFLPVGILANLTDYTDRDDRSFFGFGRLRRDCSLAQAQTDLNQVAAGLARQYPDTNADTGVILTDQLDKSISEQRPVLALLFGATVAGLVICGVNSANLRLNQAARDYPQWAVRCALGANQGHIAATLLAEGLVLVLASLGIAAFLVLCLWPSISALVTEKLPTLAHRDGLDLPVLGYSLALLAALVIGVGLVPLWRIRNIDLARVIQRGERTATSERSTRAFQAASTILQVALSFALQVVAILLLQTLWNSQKLSLNFDPQDLLTLKISLPDYQYTSEPQVRNFADRLSEQIAAVPGVEAVGLSNNPPFSGTRIRTTLVPPASVQQNAPSAKPAPSIGEYVSQDYFRTLHLPLLSGRAFTSDDRPESPKVVVVSQILAERFWPDHDPVGQKLINPANPAGPGYTVVGVVPTVRHDDLTPGAPTGTIYFSDRQSRLQQFVVLVRSQPGAPAQALMQPVRNAVSRVDATLPVYEARTMREAMQATLIPHQVASRSIVGFALLATLLLVLGFYGVLSSVVSQRQHEIAIRLALGATRSHIARQILGFVARTTGLGIAAGVALFFVLRQVVSSRIVYINVNPLLGVAAGVLALLLVAIVASLIPVWRATRLDPNVVLRAA